MKKKLLILLVLLFIISSTIIIFTQTYFAATWNITGDTFSHDPCVIKTSNGWWQFFTSNGVGVKSSSNGTQWNGAGSVFPSNLSWWSNYVPDKTDRNIWAPDIFYYNGRYWLYYSVSTFGSNTSAIGLASCTQITSGGTWRDDGLVINSTSSNNYNCIDPCIVEDNSGELWLSFGSFWTGIKMVKVNKSTMKPDSNPQIYSLANASEIEASYIVYNNGYYYLFVSFGKCCQGVNSTYKIAYGRSTKITGPYLDKNNVNMSSGGGTILDSTDGNWIGPGGQSVAKNGNQFIMVSHAYDGNRNGTATLRIKDLYFDTNGWPTYNYVQTTVTPVTNTPTPGAICGDVNSSRTVDITDALLIAQYYVGTNPQNFNRNVADVDRDGNIRIQDALLVAQYYVGITDNLSCN